MSLFTELTLSEQASLAGGTCKPKPKCPPKHKKRSSKTTTNTGGAGGAGGNGGDGGLAVGVLNGNNIASGIGLLGSGTATGGGNTSANGGAGGAGGDGGSAG